jgi:hypothetical protein
VEEDHPGVDRQPRLADLGEEIVALVEAVLDRLDLAVKRALGAEVDGAVFREIDLAGLAPWPDELAGVVAAGERHRVEAKALQFTGNLAERALGEIPCIGIDRSVCHRGSGRPRT